MSCDSAGEMEYASFLTGCKESLALVSKVHLATQNVEQNTGPTRDQTVLRRRSVNDR